MERYRQLTLELIDKHGPLDLVVWPETIQVAPVVEGNLENHLRSYVRTDRREGLQSRVLDTPVLLGLNVERATIGSEPTITNTAVLFDGTGVSGWYDKRVLVPVGEQPVVMAVPGFDGWELLAPVTRYSPGTAREPLRLGNHKMSAMICYEDLLAAHVRDLVSNGNPEFLVSLSSDAWFEGDVARALHFMLASLRAVETRRQLLRVTHDGLSGLVASTGATVWSLPTKVLASDAVSARWLAGVTLYSRLGDALTLWFAALTILLGVGMRQLRNDVR